MDYGVIKESSAGFQVANVGIIDKISTVYHYCGHLYYLGVHIILIFQCSSLTFNHLLQVDEILPFVGSHLASDVFDPIISQIYWKNDHKLVDVSQIIDYPFYCIHSVDLEKGVMIAHLVFTQGDREDAQELGSSGVHVNNNNLPHKYTISTFRLQLVVGDHVKVIAGMHKAVYGMVITLVSGEGHICIIPYGGEKEQSVSYCACDL